MRRELPGVRHTFALILLCLVVQLSPKHVARVIDGDTFVLYHVGIPAEERIRLLGVDTPERGKPGFTEAMAFTSSWLSQGDFILTACKRDSFGRMLATAQRGEHDLGHDLITAGFAEVFKP